MPCPSMAQEGVRHLTSTHRKIKNKQKSVILGRFMVKLKRSGYSQSLRREILVSAVNTQRKR